MIRLTSAAFSGGEPIPKKNSREGDDLSPPLSWTGIPEGTKEIAILCDDPDAPTAKPWVHWVAWGIAPDQTAIGEGEAAPKEGVTDFGSVGYGGPMPPPGHGVHHYHFKIFAVSSAIGLDPGASKKDLLRAIDGLVLDEGELVGTYER